MVTCATGFLFATSPGRADTPSFDLAWTAPEGCPSRQRIVEATRTRLGESSRRDAAPELFVQGTVSRERGGFVVALALKDANGQAVGEREVHVEGTSCNAVEEPAALVLAMMIAARPRVQPGGAALGAPETAPSSEQPAPPPPPKLPPARPALPAPVHAAMIPRLSLGAAGVASAGVLPDVGVGLTLRGMYSPGSIFWFGLEATFEVGGSVKASEGDVGFQFIHGSALAGLQLLRTPRIELVLTAGVRVGVIRILPDGFAVVQNEARTAALTGPGALVRAKLAPHIFAEALPELDVVLIRDHFQIRDGERVLPIHRPELFAARLSLGLAYEFR